MNLYMTNRITDPKDFRLIYAHSEAHALQILEDEEEAFPEEWTCTHWCDLTHPTVVYSSTME